MADRQELSDLISEMVGELSALHIYVRDGDARKGPDTVATASLGAELTSEANGWRIARIVEADPDFPSALSPLARPEAGVRSGDLITAINGQPVSSLGPVDTYEFAKAVQQHQAQAVRWTLESHVKQMQRYMAEQKRGVAA